MHMDDQHVPGSGCRSQWQGWSGGKGTGGSWGEDGCGSSSGSGTSGSGGGSRHNRRDRGGQVQHRNTSLEHSKGERRRELLADKESRDAWCLKDFMDIENPIQDGLSE